MIRTTGIETPPERLETEAVDLSVEETVCRRIIADYRVKLDYFLMLPCMEAVYEEGLSELDLPGPRKGIGLRAALSALLLENRYDLIRWSFRRMRQHFPSTAARRIDRMFGLDLFSTLEIDEYLTDRQWTLFSDNLLFVMARHHRRYKRAQGIMFHLYRDLIEMTVNRTVFDAAKRHDAVQEGSMALLHAVDKVEDSKASFGAYAQSWIKRQVKNFLMGERFAVHVPINLACKTLSYKEGEESKGSASGDPAEKKAARLMERLRQPSISLNEVLDDSLSLSEKLPDELTDSPLASVSKKDLRSLVSVLVHHLTAKQREVLEMRFGMGADGRAHTLSEIAEKIGISHQQVSMREKRGLQKLQSALAPYLDEIYG